MNYAEFKNRFRSAPLIFSRDVEKLDEGYQTTRNQLSRWQAKGLIVKLKRGIYLLNAYDRKVNPNLAVIANQLYQPSYVSMEYALNYYGLIPERVTDLTSITTKKTARFRNKLGQFIYQHIQPSAFRGFVVVREKAGGSFFIAEPEKAVVDFLHLNLNKFGKNLKDVFEGSYRFQNTNILKQRRIIELSCLFNENRLTGAARGFCDFMKKERRK